MRIYIIRMDEQLTQQGHVTGYRVHFRSEWTGGIALLAATHSVGPTLRGQEICVEVEAQSFDDLRLLSTEEPRQYSLIALPQEGCYQAVGQIVEAPPMEDEDFAMIHVRVADAWFRWTLDVRDSNALSLGNWISFKVGGLILWDMNL